MHPLHLLPTESSEGDWVLFWTASHPRCIFAAITWPCYAQTWLWQGPSRDSSRWIIHGIRMTEQQNSPQIVNMARRASAASGDGTRMHHILLEEPNCAPVVFYRSWSLGRLKFAQRCTPRAAAMRVHKRSDCRDVSGQREEFHQSLRRCWLIKMLDWPFMSSNKGGTLVGAEPKHTPRDLRASWLRRLFLLCRGFRIRSTRRTRKLGKT